jgi:hypothetical protein
MTLRNEPNNFVAKHDFQLVDMARDLERCDYGVVGARYK